MSVNRRCPRRHHGPLWLCCLGGEVDRCSSRHTARARDFCRCGKAPQQNLTAVTYDELMPFKAVCWAIGAITVVTLASCGLNANSTHSIATEADVSSSSTSPNQLRPAGPQEPPCGTIEISEIGIISGQQFQNGTYLIHSFGMACDQVMGDNGLFMSFLRLDGAQLPDPWKYLEGAVGAPKFAAGPAVGFRVQRIS